MRSAILTFLILCLGSFPSLVLAKPDIVPANIPAYNYNSANQMIQAMYQNPRLTHTNNINTRLDMISQLFLGKPYLEGALGEGKQSYYDQSPLYRTDAFDCVTFVSTVLALAESVNLKQFQCTIQAINYRNNIPSFTTRNHFMETDWNLENARKGYLQDITRTITDQQGKPLALHAFNIINKANWFQDISAERLKFYQPMTQAEFAKRLSQLRAQSRYFSPHQRSPIYYIPFSQLFDAYGQPNMYLFRQIPAGAIIELIRPTWPSGDQYVSHVGLTVLQNGELMFREASLDKQQVVDLPLIRYFARSFPLNVWNGINIQKIILKVNPSSTLHCLTQSSLQ